MRPLTQLGSIRHLDFCTAPTKKLKPIESMYATLFFFLRLFSRLPLRVHYLFSDGILFPLAYHVIRYRRKLVSRQLADSFPEKNEQERKQIEKRFYKTSFQIQSLLSQHYQNSHLKIQWLFSKKKVLN